MIGPQHAALICTVLLLGVTAYFFLGSVPLLLLKHDNPVDARFIRSFYNTYYLFALCVASATAVSYAMAGRPAFATGAALIAMIAWVQRGKVLPMMEQLGARIQAEHISAIPEFRAIHKTAIAINLVQLVVVLGSLSAI